MNLYAYTGTRAFIASQATVVMLHGAGNDHSVWAWQSRYLAHHGVNVLAYDLPGHGQSSGPNCQSVEEFAQTILNDVKRRGILEFALVGHSMGSLISLAISALAPQAVTHLALIGTAVPMAVGDVLLNAARNHPASAYAMIRDWGLSGPAQWAKNPAPGACIPAASVRLMQMQDELNTACLYSDLSACKAYQGGIAAAQAYSGKTLLILGAEDRMTPPKAAQALQDALSNPLIHLLPGIGHGLMNEAPVLIRQLLTHFLHASR